jgi:hypothetical protein
MKSKQVGPASFVEAGKDPSTSGSNHYSQVY